MKGYMENWVGDRDMPKDIGGWQNGQKAYHIRFMNKKGVDILHLKYSKSAANTLVDKYNRCLLYTSPSPRDYAASRMPSSA